MNTVYKVIYPILAVVVAALILFLVYTLINNNQQSTDETNVPQANTDLIERFTMAQVEAANNIDQECLMVYNNNVYRIPSTYPAEHPAGPGTIVNNCGKDVTEMFDRAHPGSETAFADLSRFFAGVLEQ